MDIPTSIDQPDAVIAAHLSEWKRHRLLIGGTPHVRANSTLFIPQVRGQTNEDYKAYVARVSFYQAALKTHAGLIGLLFRRPAKVNEPGGYADVLNTITRTGISIEALARKLASEFLITNYVALVVDFPNAPKGISKQEAIDKGVRPYISMYRAESILGVPETGVVNNRQRVVRVRLLDDANTVRELLLKDGVYSVVIHRKVDQTWVADEPIIPLRKGKPLDEIPFTLATTNDEFMPGNAYLASVCELNADHYIAAADYATMRYFSTVRVFTSAGVKTSEELPVYPGAHWKSEDPNVKHDILEATGNTISDLREALEDIEGKMALMGSRILEKPKEVGESAETIALRRAADNAAVAAMAREINMAINDALKWVAYWLDLPEKSITYDTNTNFNAMPLTPQECAQIMAEWQGGLYSKKEALARYVAHGNLPENFDMEEDQRLVDQELADRPPVDAAPVEGVNG